MAATSGTGGKDVSGDATPTAVVTRKAHCPHHAVESVAGWATVLGATAAWDIWALRGGHTTLSTAYGSAARHPLGRVALLVADTVLLAHLWGWPRSARRLDPFAMAARRLSAGATGR